jgi:quinol monooxygenase YgiN
VYARNVTIRIKREQLEEVIQFWKETLPAAVRQQEGFIRAHLLVDRTSGTLRSVGFWETEADLERSAEWNQEQIAKFERFESFFTAPPVVEHFQVVAEVATNDIDTRE